MDVEKRKLTIRCRLLLQVITGWFPPSRPTPLCRLLVEKPGLGFNLKCDIEGKGGVVEAVIAR